MQRRQRQVQPTNLKAKAVGIVVRELRKQAGHSQERLSADCGFDRTYISRLERGILNPTVSRLWVIADVLETPLSKRTEQMELWIADHERPTARCPEPGRPCADGRAQSIPVAKSAAAVPATVLIIAGAKCRPQTETPATK